MADVVQLPVNVPWALPTCRIELALFCSRLAQRPHSSDVITKEPCTCRTSRSIVRDAAAHSAGALPQTSAGAARPSEPVMRNPSAAGFFYAKWTGKGSTLGESVERNPGTRRRSACFCVLGAGRGDPCDKAVPRFLGRDAPAAHCRSRGPLHTSYRPTLMSCPPVPTQKPSVVA